jgi:DNA mismatch repair protein MutS2
LIGLAPMMNKTQGLVSRTLSTSARRKSCYTAIGMDEKSIKTLEFSVVLDRLAAKAAFSASKELARALQPTLDVEEARERQTRTSEARYLLSINDALTIGGARDVRQQVDSAIHGVVLEPPEFLDLKNTLISARGLRRYFEKLEQGAPLLRAYAMEIIPATGLIDAISRTLNDRGEVNDSASQDLARIRRELRTAGERLNSKLQKLIGDPKIVKMLQEPIITQRDGRFVVPLRAEFKGKLKSVVHDQSSSGATLFVEPLPVVDLNNQVRELELAERDEIRRILSELTAAVADQAEVIEATVVVLAELDLAFAKARYAEELDASEPILHALKPKKGADHPGSRMRLIGARHPLLDLQSVVPIDLELEENVYGLVITGPNTGGKTVTLKTVGLMTLMAQSGLHLPVVSGSELSVFDSVFADIGDEQSIEQSLSTFSAHISNVVHILEKATSKSLVLLDELGAGTDPQEGAALARSILSVLLDQKVTTMVATHYPEMKTFAHSLKHIRNASVEFDLETLTPTYHLMVGLPGRSNALAIAERLGLPAEVVERARSMVAPEELRAEDLLDEIHHQRDLTRQARMEAEEIRRRVQGQESDLSARLENIEDERYQILEQARLEAQAELETLKEELKKVRRQLSAARQPLEAIKPIEESLKALDEEVDEPVVRRPTERPQEDRPFQLGDKVELVALQTDGVITTLDADQVEVQVGRLRVRARLDELRHVGGVDEPSPKVKPKPTSRPTRVRKAALPQAPPLELDLRGRTVEEALAELDHRLDAAFVSGLPMIRVIHGKGTGALRHAVREAMGGRPQVGSFSPGMPNEGGDGVTIVKLAL